MSIIVVSRTTRYGGISTFLFNFIKYLDLEKNDYLFLDFNINKDLLKKIKKKTNCNIILFPEFPNNKIIRRMLQNIFLMKFLKKLKKKNCVYYADWNIILDYLTLFIKTNSYGFVHTYPNNYLPKIIRNLNTNLIKNMNVITVSNYSKKMINEKWFSKDINIEVLYNPSSLQGTNYIKSTRKTFKCITVAHCETYKNPELWIEVANEIVLRNKDIHFHWYGDGSQYQFFNDLTKDNKNIHFHGYKDNIEDIFLKSHLYLQFSTIESLGISILDAMNYSLPSIVTNVGGMPELIQNGINGYVTNDKDEIIKQIESLYNDQSKYKDYSKNSKEIYNNEFSSEIWEKKLDSFIKEYV